MKNKAFLDLENITSLKPEHISLYCLEIEKGCKFYGKINLDEEKQSKFYFIIKDFLEEKGYIHYEISNFAYDGKFSLHNLNYWNYGEYLGFGPSAFSTINHIRWKNKSNVDIYVSALNNGKIELEYIERLNEKDIMNERLMLGFRKIEGIDVKSDIFKLFGDKINKKIKEGYLEVYNGRVKVKKEYLFVSNKIISDMFL